jgi:hypothetical protein
MVRLPEIEHTCRIFDYCIAGDSTEILFCAFCRKVVGMREGNIMRLIPSVFTSLKQKEYTEENLKEWV